MNLAINDDGTGTPVRSINTPTSHRDTTAALADAFLELENPISLLCGAASVVRLTAATVLQTPGPRSLAPLIKARFPAIEGATILVLSADYGATITVPGSR